MQRDNYNIDIPDDLAALAGEWLDAAMQGTKFFTNIKGSPDSGRLFGEKFQVDGINLQATDGIAKQIDTKLQEQATRPLLEDYHHIMKRIASGLGNKITPQKLENIKEFKMSMLASLRKNAKFAAAWDNMLKNMDNLPNQLNQQIATNKQNLENANNPKDKARFEKERDALQQQKEILETKGIPALKEQMELKVLGGLAYKVMGSVDQLVAKPGEMDRLEHNLFVIILNQHENKPSDFLKGQVDLNAPILNNTFNNQIVINALSEPDANKRNTKLQSSGDMLKTTLETIDERNAQGGPKNVAYMNLGETGKKVLNTILNQYMTEIKNAPGDKADKQQFLQSASESILSHLKKRAFNSDDLDTIKSTRALLKEIKEHASPAIKAEMEHYLEKTKLVISPEAAKATADIKGSRIIKSTTAGMLNKLATPEQLEKREKKLSEMKSEGPARNKLTKREPEKPSVEALNPNAPNQVNVSQQKVAPETVHISPGLGKR